MEALVLQRLPVGIVLIPDPTERNPAMPAEVRPHLDAPNLPALIDWMTAEHETRYVRVVMNVDDVYGQNAGNDPEISMTFTVEAAWLDAYGEGDAYVERRACASGSTFPDAVDRVLAMIEAEVVTDTTIHLTATSTQIVEGDRG